MRLRPCMQRRYLGNGGEKRKNKKSKDKFEGETSSQAASPGVPFLMPCESGGLGAPGQGGLLVA